MGDHGLRGDQYYSVTEIVSRRQSNENLTMNEIKMGCVRQQNARVKGTSL